MQIQAPSRPLYIPDDQTMPGLPTALDPLAMQNTFQQLLFGMPANLISNRQITTCTIERIKYRASQKCVISYRLHIVDRASGEEAEQWLCARVFPMGTAIAKYRKACKEPLATPAFGEAVMVLPTLDMVVWAFPNDRKISGLPTLMAAVARENSWLDEIVTATWGAETIIGDHVAKLVHYVPEHTCVLRVQLALRNPMQPVPDTVTLFGKAYYNDEGAETYRLMCQLWQDLSAEQGLHRPQRQIAQPLAYDPDVRVLWQMGLPGRTLLTYELGSPDFQELLGEAAQAVALLHRTALPCRRTTNQRAWLDQLSSRRELVAHHCPHLAISVKTLVTALRCLLPNAQREPQATLHGDLHLQNFFVDDNAIQGHRLALIDLDNLSTGSPWSDLGSLCAGLYYRGLVDGVAQPVIHQMIDHLCACYAEQVPWPLDRQAIDWYTAAALLNERAFRAITRMKQGRLAMIDDFVRIATEVVLGQMVRA
jgi:hypothetical protein